MNLEKLAELVIETLEENKATNIITLDVRDLTSVADLMIIASGTSSKQVTAIAEKLIEKAKKNKVPPFGSEGKQYGELNGYWSISATSLSTSCTQPHVRITNWKNSGRWQMIQILHNRQFIK